MSGILFNHESPRRGENFVTRKITKAVAAIDAGVQDHVSLGNLDAIRDWGLAPEYVEGMWRMLQQDEPDDFVMATGEGHTVREFCDAAFSHVGLNWEDHVRYDESFTRPSEVDALIGDASKAHRELGWKAHTTALDLARLMVEADLWRSSAFSAADTLPAARVAGPSTGRRASPPVELVETKEMFDAEGPLRQS